MFYCIYDFMSLLSESLFEGLRNIVQKNFWILELKLIENLFRIDDDNISLRAKSRSQHKIKFTTTSLNKKLNQGNSKTKY